MFLSLCKLKRTLRSDSPPKYGTESGALGKPFEVFKTKVFSWTVLQTSHISISLPDFLQLANTALLHRVWENISTMCELSLLYLLCFLNYALDNIIIRRFFSLVLHIQLHLRYQWYYLYIEMSSFFHFILDKVSGFIPFIQMSKSWNKLIRFFGK